MSSLKYFVKLILYQPLYNVLIFLVWLMPGNNVGLSIIILTIVVRIILLPSSLKAIRQQKRMRDLQPELQKVQEKYKDDKQKQSQAMMAFYRENKIHPLGSCLPLLVQFPILIILYYVFINGLDTSHFDLLYSFIPRPEKLQTVFLGIDLAKPDRYILPIIAGVLQYFQGRQIMPPSGSRKSEVGGQKGQDIQSMMSKQMLYLMPVFTVIIAGQLPAALPLYWAVTTLFAIGQQWWVFRENPKSETRNPKLLKDTLSIEKKENKIVKKGVEVTVRRKK